MSTQCKSCKASIDWVTTTNGKPMPVDSEPYITIITDEGRTVKGRTSHFATCPNAPQHRKAKA